MVKSSSTIPLVTQVRFDVLAPQLVDNLNHDALRRLIRQIDALVADYHFTKQLRDHFIREIEKEDAETAIRDHGTPTKEGISS